MIRLRRGEISGYPLVVSMFKWKPCNLTWFKGKWKLPSKAGAYSADMSDQRDSEFLGDLVRRFI